MDKDRIKEIIKGFNEKKIAVVGDISIDSYAYGNLREHNPDKDGKPLLTVDEEVNTLGCGGNCVANVASLGGDVIFYGVIGKDTNAEIVEEICKENGINAKFVKDGKTIVKRRLITKSGDYITRVDYGENELKDISEEDKVKLLSYLEKDNPEVIILSDYNKRIFRGDFSERIIQKFGEKVIVDPKPANISKFVNAGLICPNLKEAREIVGSNSDDVEKIAEKFKEKINCKNTIISLNESGLICYDGENIKKIPTYAKKVESVMGAGDSLKAGISLALSAGANFFEAAEIGSLVAGIAVEKPGTSCVTQNELLDRLD